MQLSFENSIDISSYDSILQAIKRTNLKVAAEFEYPDNVVLIVKSKSKGKDNLYSIYLNTKNDIYYVDAPYSKKLIAKIDYNKKFVFMVDEWCFEQCNFEGRVELKDLKNPINFVEVTFFDIEDFFFCYDKILRYIFKNYRPSHKFLCCHRYANCSKIGKCQHEDKLYAKGCDYRWFSEFTKH